MFELISYFTKLIRVITSNPCRYIKINPLILIILTIAISCSIIICEDIFYHIALLVILSILIIVGMYGYVHIVLKPTISLIAIYLVTSTIVQILLGLLDIQLLILNVMRLLELTFLSLMVIRLLDIVKLVKVISRYCSSCAITLLLMYKLVQVSAILADEVQAIYSINLSYASISRIHRIKYLLNAIASSIVMKGIEVSEPMLVRLRS